MTDATSSRGRIVTLGRSRFTRWHTRLALAGGFCLVSAPVGASCVAPVLSQGLHAGYTIVDREDTTRQYDLYVGSTYDAASSSGAKPVPLIVDLHGLDATATAQRLLSH